MAVHVLDGCETSERLHMAFCALRFGATIVIRRLALRLVLAQRRCPFSKGRSRPSLRTAVLRAVLPCGHRLGLQSVSGWAIAGIRRPRSRTPRSSRPRYLGNPPISGGTPKGAASRDPMVNYILGVKRRSLVRFLRIWSRLWTSLHGAHWPNLFLLSGNGCPFRQAVLA